MRREGFTFIQFFLVLLVLATASVFVFRTEAKPDFSAQDDKEWEEFMKEWETSDQYASALENLDIPKTSPSQVTSAPVSVPASKARPAAAKPASSGPTVLKNVQIVSIPDAVYRAGGDFSQYLNGDKKRIFMLALPGCPYSRAFRRKLDALFASSDYKNYYTRDIVNVGSSETVFCRNCPKEWLFDHCGEGICIIDPQTRQAVIDNSQNSAQLAVLLERFKEW